MIAIFKRNYDIFRTMYFPKHVTYLYSIYW